MLTKRRILVSIHEITVGLAKARKTGDWCVACRRCRLIWYLTSAIKLGDPYKVVEINDLLIGMGLDFELSPEVSGYLQESKAWVRSGALLSNTTEVSEAVRLIHRWKLHQLTSSDLDALRVTPAHLHWMLVIVRASLLETYGDCETAVQDYRRALKIMPRWLPEAKVAYEKINELMHQKSS